MNNDNVAAVRNAYAVAERKDLEGWINLFTPDGVFTDNSAGATYCGREVAETVPGDARPRQRTCQSGDTHPRHGGLSRTDRASRGRRCPLAVGGRPPRASPPSRPLKASR